MKGKFLQFALGVFTGAALFGGATAIAAGITAEPSWSPIYVDGQQVQMTAYNIGGSNYVKLRDIGQAVGFNVYYQHGVQVDSTSPYTGEAPVQPQVPAQKNVVSIGSVKGTTLKAGERSGLITGPGEVAVTSSNPAVVSVEKVLDNWVAVAHADGTAVLTATDASGGTGQLTLTVKAASAQSGTVDLTANTQIRQEMIRLINQVRRENGVAELPVNEALMNAAQDCSAQMFSSHNSQYECETAMAYGYPHGFGSNLTWFTGFDDIDGIAQKAVSNWVKSSGHFQTMTAERYDCIGVGVTIRGGETCCFMFVGNPNSYNPYE